MSALIGITKSGLTRVGKTLAAEIQEARKLTSSSDPARIEVAVVRLTKAGSSVDEAIEKLASALDDIEAPRDEEVEDVTKRTEAAMDITDRATHTLLDLHELLQMAKAKEAKLTKTSTVTQVEHVTAEPTHRGPKLSLPRFSGKKAEWPTFWGIFEHTVHGAQASNLYKFAALSQAMTGEAKDLVDQFQFTEENYTAAIGALKEKFGGSGGNINEMYRTLNGLQATNFSTTEQRKLLTQIQLTTSQLKNYGEHMDSRLHTHLIFEKFSKVVQRDALMNDLKGDEAEWTMSNVLTALDKSLTREEKLSEFRVTHLEKIQKHEEKTDRKEKSSSNTQNHEKSQNQKGRTKKQTVSCIFCGEGHLNYKCEKFRTPFERANRLKELKRCQICLKTDHSEKDCSSTNRCKNCGKNHHRLICTEKSTSQKKDNISSTATKPAKDFKILSAKTGRRDTKTDESRKKHLHERSAQHETNGEGNTLHLASTEGKIHHGFHTTIRAQAFNVMAKRWDNIDMLLDSGADVSFIKESIAKKWGLSSKGTVHFALTTFADEEPKDTKGDIVELKLRTKHEEKLNLKLVTTSILTGKVAQAPITDEDWTFIKEQRVTIGPEQVQREIDPDVIIGADHFWDLVELESQRIRLPSGTQLIPTCFGYVLTGRPTSKDTSEKSKAFMIRALSLKATFTDQTPREEDHIPRDKTEEFTRSLKEEKEMINKDVHRKFEETIQRKSDGYHVRYPWTEGAMELPDHRVIAERRLQHVVSHQPQEILKQIDDIFKDQAEKGIIEEVDWRKKPKGLVHYNPHQPVLTPGKETTKCRVVFDASCHFKGGLSLNDVILAGPVLLPDTVGILLRLRTGARVVVSDVEKAFLQVRVQEIDRDATRCLWIRDLSKPPTKSNTIVYRFTRVIFGVNASPFLLAATIYHHLDNHVEDKELGKRIKNNLYVDNLILTTDSHKEARDIYTKTKKIFGDLEMNLREYLTNDTKLMMEMDQQDVAKKMTTKILGIHWNAETDILSITTSFGAAKATKRIVSSQLSAVYDPLGWLVPLLLPSKLFLQDLWNLNFDWDTILPDELQDRWTKLAQRISGFTVQIPRDAIKTDSPVTLICCTDASNRAVAACCYVQRSEGLALLVAKSKLAPTQSVPTIPKMEIHALSIGTQLTFDTVKALESTRAQIADVIILSDSTIALEWVKHAPGTKPIGVWATNRVRQMWTVVEELTKKEIGVQFGYINTKDNPADCATRGVTNEDFAQHIWWTGPEYTRHHVDTWPAHTKLFTLQDISAEPDLQPIATIATVKTDRKSHEEHAENSLFQIERFSSLRKAQRVAARVCMAAQLFKKGAENKEDEKEFEAPEGTKANSRKVRLRPLLQKDLEVGLEALIKANQENIPSTKAKWSNLQLRQDDDGFWRCQGRLGKGELHEDTRYPVFINPNTHLARLLIMEAHGKYHGSVAQTIATVREKYWIPQLRKQVSQLLRKCVACQRHNSQSYRYPDTKALPPQRVTKARPFERCGLDYFGPLNYKDKEGLYEKAYGCIITCSVTRLIYLDIAETLGTVHFLNVLRRFFSCYGIPHEIISDNAPTFILGEKIVQDTWKTATTKQLEEHDNHGITWSYITPYSPWQGGFYERLIRSVKLSLNKAIGRTTLSKDDLLTTLQEIASTLNSRPLTYQEALPEPEKPLRPIDFLQKGVTITFPWEQLSEGEDANYAPPEEKAALQTRKQAISALQSSHEKTEDFWRIWREQYLTALRETHKVHIGKPGGKNTSTPSVGMIVLLDDPFQPRNVWKLARITAVKHSDDNQIREVTVKTANQRTVKRPVNQVVPLELESPWKISKGTTVEKSQEKILDTGDIGTKRYELRPRQKIVYREDSDEELEEEAQKPPPNTKSRNYYFQWQSLKWKNGLTILTLITLFSLGQGHDIHDHAQINCTRRGLRINAPTSQLADICAGSYCKQVQGPLNFTDIWIPSSVKLHEHAIRWKSTNENGITSQELTCPAQPFCETLECIFCLENIANPECSPTMAMLGTAVILYAVIWIAYSCFCVIRNIGGPILGAGQGIYVILRLTLKVLFVVFMVISYPMRIWKRRQQRNDRRTQGRKEQKSELSTRPAQRTRWELLALAIVLIPHSMVGACQDVDIIAAQAEICTNTDNCTVKTEALLHINDLRKEACLRLHHNGTAIKEVRLTWRNLGLTCAEESITFTRDTQHDLLSSKRCPHMGSCTGEKCKSINRTSILPELKAAENFPGVTGCSESCGGPGCDCFYLSSGCLFYRIFLRPQNEHVYEILRCATWKEALKVHAIITTLHGQNPKKEEVVLSLQPNVPIQWGPIGLTLSGLHTPYNEYLDSWFVRRNGRTAVWQRDNLPPFRCLSAAHARNLTGNVVEECDCHPAESEMKCVCRDQSIEGHMSNMKYQLPLYHPAMTLLERKKYTSPGDQDGIRAVYDGTVTTEITTRTNAKSEILTFKDVTDAPKERTPRSNVDHTRGKSKPKWYAEATISQQNAVHKE